MSYPSTQRELNDYAMRMAVGLPDAASITVLELAQQSSGTEGLAGPSYYQNAAREIDAVVRQYRRSDRAPLSLGDAMGRRIIEVRVTAGHTPDTKGATTSAICLIDGLLASRVYGGVVWVDQGAITITRQRTALQEPWSAYAGTGILLAMATLERDVFDRFVVGRKDVILIRS